MSPAKLSRREARMAQIAVAVAELEDRGTCWDAWARERGLPRQAVINVRKGDRPCWTGDVRRVADQILGEARRPEPEGEYDHPPLSLYAALSPSLPLPGWDDTWPVEYVFQAVAVFLATRLAPAGVHVLDTSKLSVPDDYNRSVAGAPDIVAGVNGRYVEIELKTRNGKPTGPQERESERVANAGSRYVVARTMREVFEALEIETPEIPEIEVPE